MSFVALWLRVACGLLVAGLVIPALPTDVLAQTAKFSISKGPRAFGGSNLRFQIGGGLPIPITGAGTTAALKQGMGAHGPAICTPPFTQDGVVSTVTTTGGTVLGPGAYSVGGNCENRVIPLGGYVLKGGGAWVTQTTALSVGNKMKMPKGLFKVYPNALLGGHFPINIGVLKANPAVFQVLTDLTIKAPALYTGVATGNTTPAPTFYFSIGGRTGPPTAYFCPGGTATLGVNCSAAGAKAKTGVPGRMKYTKTVNGLQYGGGARGNLSGTADVALVKTYPALGTLCTVPGKCAVSFVYATPYYTGVNGATFGESIISIGKIGKRYQLSGITTGGAITKVGPYLAQATRTNAPTSFGGPWTTGMMTMTATATAFGGSEMFTRTGSDNRVSGIGNISLVAGAVSARTTSGPNANRGWMTLTVPEPAAMLSAAGALLALVACHRLARRRR